MSEPVPGGADPHTPPGNATVSRPSRRRPPRRPTPAALPERTPDPERLVIGRIAGAHGAHGEFKLAILSSHPEHFPALKRVYLGDEPAPRRLEQVHLRRGDALLRVEGLTAAEEVARRRGQLVWIDRADAMPLPEGEYYHYQLLDLDVVDVEGHALGRLVRIIETGANDVYVVQQQDGELLLPALEAVIHEVDLANHRMVVTVPEYY